MQDVWIATVSRGSHQDEWNDWRIWCQDLNQDLSSWVPITVLVTMIDIAVSYCNSCESLWEEGWGDMEDSCVGLKWSSSQMVFMCWLDMKFESDGVDRNCQQLWKTTTTVCYECIHCHLFIAVLLSILDTFCHAILNNCRIAIYILHMLCVEVHILHTGEASGHPMICISRLWDKRADIFHIEVYIPSEEAMFCCYCNLYFKCRGHICYWVLQLLLWLQQVAFYFQVWKAIPDVYQCSVWCILPLCWTNILYLKG